VDVALSPPDRPAALAPEESTSRRSRVQEALDFLFARTAGGFRFGLERTRDLLAHLGNPHRRYAIVHVAGTNGKGSSVATMDALLRDPARPRRVARYTSPHLVDFRERIVVDDDPIPADDIVAFVDRHIDTIERIEASFFEATTAMAFDYFARAGTDIALIEAGLGGRLDSTNVVDPVVAGVTSIGFDHTEYLGNTLEEIAREKAGIFKPSRPAVIGEHDATIRALLADAARNAGASSVRVVADEIRCDDVAVSNRGTELTVSGLGDRRRLRTPLTGNHQAANLAFALTMLDAAGDGYRVGLGDAASRLADVRIPGRFQHVGQYIFDVAHNAAGAAVVAQTVASVQPPAPVVVVLCVLRDKDWREMIRVLRPVASHFILTMAPTAPTSRAWNLDEVVTFAAGDGISAEPIADFDAALARAREIGATVLITGSFHTVGDAMARLQVSPLAR
jgi:dihydrofolate synthase/folylpolyglutamate synthase